MLCSFACASITSKLQLCGSRCNIYALYVSLQREQASIEGSNLAAIQLKLTQSQQELEKLKSNSSTAEAALNKSNGMTWYYKFAIIMCASPFPQYGWLVTLLSQARLLSYYQNLKKI